MSRQIVWTGFPRFYINKLYWGSSWVDGGLRSFFPTFLISTFQGIGVLGVLFSAILLIAAFAVYFRGYQTYEDYEYPGFIDKDRRCNEFPTEKIIGVTITSIYFALFWMVPSHLLLMGLFTTGKIKTLSKGLKFLPWILSMLFHPTLFFIMKHNYQKKFAACSYKALVMHFLWHQGHPCLDVWGIEN